MGNLVSSVIKDVSVVVDDVENIFDGNTSSETYEEKKDYNISTNNNLKKLNNNLLIVNNSVEDEFREINYNLSNINYKDNDIKKNQELLQLKANEYNRNKNIEYNLNLKLNKGSKFIKDKRRQNLVNKFLIKLILRIIYILLALSVLLGLYFFGYLTSKMALITTSIVIIIMIIIFSFTSKNNINDIEDNSPLYEARKINNFKFKDGYNDLFDLSSGNGEEEEDRMLNLKISSELFNKCCNTESTEEEYIVGSDNVKSDCGFYYDKTLPYQIYI